MEVWYSSSPGVQWKYELSNPKAIRAIKKYIDQQETIPIQELREEYSYPLIGFKSRMTKLPQDHSCWVSETVFFQALYSNNILVEENGSRWNITLSWEEIEPLLVNAGKEERSYYSFPNLFAAVTANGTWNTSMLIAAKDPIATVYPIELNSVFPEKLVCKITNTTENIVPYDWGAICRANLQVVVDGIWYQIPGGDVWHSHVDLAFIDKNLLPGDFRYVSLYTDQWKNIWEKLPEGHYRWVWRSFSHEFDI